MTPPDPLQAQGPDAGPAASVCVLETLKKRADFLAAARARRKPMPGFVLQARARGAGEAIRVGYTCSRKVGNAVARNRAKRRLRALARDVFPACGRPGWDYVLIGRPDVTATQDFAEMRAELANAVEAVHSKRPR